MAEALCLVDHDEPRSAAPGLMLCRGHIHRLEREIAEMPSLYDELALRLHPSGPVLKPYSAHNAGGTATVNRSTSEEEAATYINGRVADLRALMLSTLACRARLVIEERGLTNPWGERLADV